MACDRHHGTCPVHAEWGRTTPAPKGRTAAVRLVHLHKVGKVVQAVVDLRRHGFGHRPPPSETSDGVCRRTSPVDSIGMRLDQ
jgi:hypothetical protein